MKKILFRGKTIEQAGMRSAGEWAYGGYFMDDCYGGCPEGKHHIVEFNSTGMGYFAHTKVEKESVGQFTGLNDKNGRKIFEGDIVKYLDGNEWSTESGYDCDEFDNIGVIFFDEECGRYDVTNKQGIGYDDLFDCGVDFEVVGNVTDNPELLKNFTNE